VGITDRPVALLVLLVFVGGVDGWVDGWVVGLLDGWECGLLEVWVIWLVDGRVGGYAGVYGASMRGEEGGGYVRR